MLRQSGGDGGRRPRSTADPDRPVGPAEPLGIELADDPDHVPVEEPPVAAGDGLFGGAEGLRQSTEGRPGIDVQSLDDPSVQNINCNGSHATDHDTWHKQVESEKVMAEHGSA